MHLPPPSPANWERRDPKSLGLNADHLTEASDFAIANEIPWPTDLSGTNVSNDPPEHAEKLGPLIPRGGPAGVVLKGGYIVHEWGDLDRVDLTFSATKSYVSTIVALAFDRGMIRDLDRPVANDIDSVEICDVTSGEELKPFSSPHNKKITWRQLLQQTSEWEGTLWAKPDTVDWNRSIEQGGAGKRDKRKEPGQHWEYNDVRVNLAALAALAIWKEPLPDVLKREVMDPIGASAKWEWHGYRNSTVTIDGKRMESVSGGAHWGGGLFIDTYDHARFGQLFLNRGEWDRKRIVSEKWIKMMLEPCDQNPRYGLMWWLNTGGARYGDAVPESLFCASGAGGNNVAIDPENDMVIVTRWCADVPGVIERAIAAAK